MSGQVILVMDPDPAVLDALQFSLEVDGYVVRGYGQGVELLLDSALPEAACLVLSARMPDLDGFGVIAALRGRGVATPVILVTSHVTDDFRLRSRHAGADAVLEKPLPGNALAAAITAIQGSRTDDIPESEIGDGNTTRALAALADESKRYKS